VKTLELTPEAGAEFVEAAAWYEAQRAGLAARFVADFHAAATRACELPASFPRLLDVPDDLTIRRALLAHFPFAVVFLELPEKIRVVAVVHAKRRPRYWLSRLR
jgi:plasmid stabilization system protein ParE